MKASCSPRPNRMLPIWLTMYASLQSPCSALAPAFPATQMLAAMEAIEKPIGHLVQIVLEDRVLVERGLVAQLALFLLRLVPQAALVARRLEGGTLGADRRHTGRQAAGLAREKRGDGDDGGKGTNDSRRLRAGGGL